MKPSPKAIDRLTRKIDPHSTIDEAKARSGRLVEEWMKGLGQGVQGETRAEFIKVFMGTFSEEARRSIESNIEELFVIRNRTRFRAKYIEQLAMAYQHGILQTKEKTEVDMLEAADRIVKERVEAAKQGLRDAVKAAHNN